MPLRLILFVLILTAAAESRAQGFSLERNGPQFPASVDLSSQLRAKTQRQLWGTCHVFAATALMEAACYRSTGKKIDISEGYFVYRHWRNELKKNPLSISEIYSSHFDWRQDDGDYFDFDGGWSHTTIQRAFNGSICSEKEFPFDQALVKELRHHTQVLKEVVNQEIKKHAAQVNEKIAKVWAIRGVEKNANQYYCDKLDQTALCIIPPKTITEKSKENGIVATSKDPFLEECFKKRMTYRSIESPSEAQVLKILTAKIPVICNRYVDYGNGRKGYHSLLYVGFRYDPQQNTLVYLARDSNGKSEISTWDRLNCSTGTTYIFNGNETDPLQ